MDEYVGNSRDPVRAPRRSSHGQLFLISKSIALILVPVISIIVSLFFPSNTSLASLAHHSLHVSKIAKLHHRPLHLPKPPYVLFSTRVVLPDNAIKSAYVVVGEDGKIQAVHRSLTSISRDLRSVIIDVKPLVIMPGLIDPHVHVNELGKTDWEGIESATKAAAAGGTTTLLDMPLNNVPETTSLSALRAKLISMEEKRPLIDIGLIGGAVHGNVGDIEGLVNGGVVAMKSFMVVSQSPGFPSVDRKDMEEITDELARLSKKEENKYLPIPYILHAELDDFEPNTGDRASTQEGYDHANYSVYERTRPDSWETEAIRMATEIGNKTGIHLHIAHVSSQDALEQISNLRNSSTFQARITSETCTHFLLWAKEEIPDGATEYKCSPPVRSRENRENLCKSVFSASNDHTPIDMIGSDHSPFPDDLKHTDGNLTNAAGGIAGLQYRLQGSWTAAVKNGGNLVTLSKLLAEAPAKVFGFADRKGCIKAGLDADFVIWDPETKTRLTDASCFHRNKLSAFHNEEVQGIVAYTILRGELVYSNPKQDERWHFGEPKGQWLYRSNEDGRIRSERVENWKTVLNDSE